MAASRRMMREYLLSLALLAAGAGLVWLAVRQDWAQVAIPAPSPMPATVVDVRGQDLVPLAGALWLVGLAGLVAVIATRRLARRLVGALLALSGLVTVVLVSMPVTRAAVFAAAAAHGSYQPSASSLRTGTWHSAYAVVTGSPWRWLALAGAVAIMAVGILVSWRGGRWPVMSSRYEAPGGRQSPPVADPAALWESLSQGIDPTDQPGLPGRPLG